ncbi:tetratricopeptide repeat protein [Thermodesulfatator atlanticus]|uniref:tetratricopeptide repeat protein n=1 Tax=Thermodesulfatator atlanticus TaxID=501497 RepID=UPI0003B51D5A|nr:tetratricopeptide repeat protein [Thermodesulfatator atlanticus]
MQKTILWPLKVLSLGCFLLFIFSAQAHSRCQPGEAYYFFLVGEYFIQQNDIAQAQQALERVVKCDPKAVTPKKELLKIYAEKGLYNKAISLAQKILAQNPDDKETLFFLAKLYWAQKREARAIETLERLLEKHPDYEEALSTLASIYLQRHDLNGAIKVFERLVKKEPQNASIYLELARLYRRKGDFDKARTYYQKALELSHGKLRIVIEYGDFLEKIGAFKEAQKLYENALKQNPEQFHLYEALLRLYIGAGNFEKALHTIERLEEIIGPNPRLLLRKALILLDLNRDQEALKILKEVVKKHPEDYTAKFYLGVAFERVGQKEKALKIYKSIPPDADVFPLAIRRVAALTNDPQEIYHLFEKALQANPDNKELYRMAASIFNQLDACNLGISLLSEGLKKFPDDLDLATSYAILLVCEGKDEEILKVLEPFLEKYPDDPTLLNFVGYTLADLNRDLDRAEKYIKKALSLKPNDGYIVDSLAWVYYRKGKYEEALKEIERALSLSPDDPIIHEHHGDILKALGLFKEACKAYQKALSLAQKVRDRERIEGKIKRLCGDISS